MDERRRYERVSFFCDLDLTVLPNGPTVKGRSFDISVAGVGITTDGLMLQRGQDVKISFYLSNGSKKSLVCEEVLGRVAYSNAEEHGTRLGVEFLEKLNDLSQPKLVEKLAKI